MSLASQVGTAAGVLAAAGAAVSLWLGAERYAGPSRRAYRWFAVASVLWGAGVIAGQVLAPPVGGGGAPLLVGCPALVSGAVGGGGGFGAAGGGGSGGRGRAPPARKPAGRGAGPPPRRPQRCGARPPACRGPCPEHPH